METQRRASIHDGIKVVLPVSIFPLSCQLTMNLLPKKFEAMLPELGMLALFPFYQHKYLLRSPGPDFKTEFLPNSSFPTFTKRTIRQIKYVSRLWLMPWGGGKNHS